jgi:hypothetical protein
MSENAGLVLLALGLFLVIVMIIALLLAPTPTRATRESPLKLKPNSPAPEVVAEADVFQQFERLHQKGAIRAAEDARNRRWLRPIGFVSRLLTYAALFLLLYIWAPKDISNTPLGSLTLSEISGTVFFVATALVLGRSLFSPSQDEETKDLWGWWGVIILGGVGLLAVYLATRH